MKPKILSNLTFIRYGHALDQGLAISPPDYLKQIIVAEDHLEPIFNAYSHPVYLEPMDGVGLIAVTQKLDEEPEIFLLDKVISVDPDIWFTILPYGCSFTYRMDTRGQGSHGHYQGLTIPKGIPSNIRINKLYTVFYQEKGKNFSFKGERHPYWELTYVDKGTLYCTVDNNQFELKQGDFIFFAPNQYHSQHAIRDTFVSFLTISFDFDSFDYDSLYNSVFKADIRIRELMQNILSEHRTNRLYSEDMISVLLTQIVIETARSIEMNEIAVSLPTPVTKETRDRVTCDLLKLIDETIGERITVNSLAKSMCMSPSSLSKTFKQHTGVSITKYIRDRRMETARELLKTGKYTITQISDMLGYCSVSYFSSEFKKKYNFSPREYARAIN